MVEDACAAFTDAQHQHVLDHVLHHFGTSTTTAAVVAQAATGSVAITP